MGALLLSSAVFLTVALMVYASFLVVAHLGKGDWKEALLDGIWFCIWVFTSHELAKWLDAVL